MLKTELSKSQINIYYTEKKLFQEVNRIRGMFNPDLLL